MDIEYNSKLHTKNIYTIRSNPPTLFQYYFPRAIQRNELINPFSVLYFTTRLSTGLFRPSFPFSVSLFHFKKFIVHSCSWAKRTLCFLWNNPMSSAVLHAKNGMPEKYAQSSFFRHATLFFYFSSPNSLMKITPMPRGQIYFNRKAITW